MRQHWLLGRVFGGGSDNEAPPVSSYQQRVRELNKRNAELDRREMLIRELEQKPGTAPRDNRK